MLEILRYPNPILREVSKPVEVINDDIRKLAEEMIETMYDGNGVGLAAPQIGRNIRMYIVDLDPENGDPHVFINPVIVKKSREKATQTEGCLSVPGIEANVTRPAEVTVRAQNLEGEVVEYDGTGLSARAFQHEGDHLDGILFVDKVSSASKLSLRGELEAMEDAYNNGIAG